MRESMGAVASGDATFCQQQSPSKIEEDREDHNTTEIPAEKAVVRGAATAGDCHAIRSA